jgi:hypothetical protein
MNILMKSVIASKAKQSKDMDRHGPSALAMTEGTKPPKAVGPSGMSFSNQFPSAE